MGTRGRQIRRSRQQGKHRRSSLVYAAQPSYGWYAHRLAVDVGYSHWRGTLQQLVNLPWQPLENSRRGSQYGAYDKELLAACASVKRFRYLLK